MLKGAVRSARARPVALLCLLVVAVGSPWSQSRLADLDPEGESAPGWVVRWLAHGILWTPAWQLSATGPVGRTWAETGAQAAVVVGILVGIAVLLPRVRGSVVSGGARTAATVGACVLTVVPAGALGWAVLRLFGPDYPGMGEALVVRLEHAAWFGLLLGLVGAVLLADSGGPHTPAAWRPTATKGRGMGRGIGMGRRGRMAGMGTPLPQLEAQATTGTAPGDVTRYLCAAAYTDEVFARRVVEEVLADEFSAVAPSVGVDLEAVARHCLAARELRNRRDLRLAAASAAVLLFGPLWLPLGALAVNAAARMAARESDRSSTRGDSGQAGVAALGRAGVLLALLLLLGAFAGAGLSSVPMPAVLRWLTGSYLLGLPALLVLCAATASALRVLVDHTFTIDRLLRTSLRREVFSAADAPAPAARKTWVTERLAAVRRAQDGNVTVYSGYTPYIGFAAAQSSWSLAVPILPPAAPGGLGGPRDDVTDFTVVDLLDHLRTRLRDIADRHGALPLPEGGARTAELLVEDRVFVNGATLADDDRFFEEDQVIPCARIAPEMVSDIALHPDGTARHHLGVHVPLWGGEVVPSVLLHLSATEQTLHLRCGTHVVGPVPAAYRTVDRLPARSTPQWRRRLLVQALGQAGGALLAALPAAWRHARFEARQARRALRDLRALQQDPAFDYGARYSIRELALSTEYHNYFQVVDGARVIAAVERHVLAGVRDFLEEHGVDTADFRAQQQTILNQGVIQQGGVSVVGNQAVGQGASAIRNQAPADSPSPTR
ncbi:hypothetical protein [Peterkaempfera bronchialis]|uniref:Uncharacterized protein n=1 Tax=Peterkaempfera bronchialis TaxID=2126346 RepID=A0A345T4N7_9ACTN|nr:hypothetical protein [Peterkaempfera bronchialis]AXI80942.1 hypothetical protein C7M71_029740 [Peterkaempfera bronchialis]